MKFDKHITNEILDEAMSQILSGVNHANVLRMLMSKYRGFRSRDLKKLLDIAHEDAMSYTNDMNNYSRY